MFKKFYKKYIFLSILFVMIFVLISPVIGITINKYIKENEINKFYQNNLNLLNNKFIDINDLELKQTFDGYTLFAPVYSTKTYLINYDKEVFYSWNSEYRPGISVYLSVNGKLLRTSFLGAHPIFYAGGMGGGIQEIDLNGAITWDFEYKNETHLSHHDIEILPNGNILMIAWEYKSSAESIAAGRNPDLIPTDSGLWPDHIIEVEPTGPTTGEIVWEWHVWDHLIQDHDPLKDNYGIITDHPELIDVNYVEDLSNINPDWTHTNSIDYNEEFDQIIISVLSFDEIWVIDHSTTTEEAAGHTGGNSGKGGDILYRWGNPRAYQAGTVNDQKLFGQHDAQWIEEGLPGEGNILVFNNGNGRPSGDFSSVEEIVPPVDDNGNYFIEPGGAYGPEEPIWTYIASNPEDFYSGGRSGVQRLPDGNTLICESDDGYFFEITSNGDVVWEYINPFPELNKNIVFKVNRYSPDYPGLQDLFQPPEIPKIITGQNVGIKGAKYTYIANSTDPNDDEIFYLFDWGDGTNSGWIGPLKSDQTCIIDNIWYQNGSYEIKIKAKDTFNLESDWSSPYEVIIGTIDPKTPTISGPPNGKPDIEYYYTFKAIDPKGSDISYYVNWGDDTNSGWTDYVTSNTEISLKHSWDNGRYIIKCKAKNLFGNESEWATMEINIPRTRTHWMRFLDIFPMLERILGKLNL